MENLINKESVKKVSECIEKFDPKLKVLVLNTTAKTANDAANSLKCEIGAIIKSLLFKADNSFLICLKNIVYHQQLSRLKNYFQL